MNQKQYYSTNGENMSQNGLNCEDKFLSLQQSLFILKNKHFSVKKSYETFINKSNINNPEAKL